MKLESSCRIISGVIFLLLSIDLHAQGNLMLVGGGGETDGGWSDTPYQWMVNQAQNQKVGIISYSEADSWLPDYFKSLGAAEAVNIKIDSRALADHPSMRDSLNQYDALFFKGGDQSRYYDYYRGTEVQSAIEDVYTRGGVIGGTSAGMAILSGVIFTASNGSAYPYDALSDINSEFMTLTNDFLSFYPAYLFDTHFVERGRTPRLIGFLANWYESTGQLISGIGIDDRTAFCIDDQRVGTVYGTGAASVYHPREFSIENDKIMNSNVKAIQLTHAQSYNFNTSQPIDRDLVESSVPELKLPFYQVFASSETTLSKTTNMLEEVISKEKLDGKILIVSNSSAAKIDSYRNFFEERVEEEIILVDLSLLDKQDEQIALRNNIRQSSLVLFLEPENLSSYFNSGPTGELLEQHIKRNKITSVFLGSVANQLGVAYANNIYEDPFNAYYGDLEFSSGLGLLQDFSIITEAYDLDEKDYYENITSAVVDRVLNENLAYGVYLTGSTYFSYTLDESNQAVMKLDGNLSSVVVENSGTNFAQTDQTVSGTRSRMQYAFDSLNYILTKGTEFELGEALPKDQLAYEFEEENVLSTHQLKRVGISLLQNPVENKLKLRKTSVKSFDLQMFTTDGKLVFRAILKEEGLTEFFVGAMPSAKYILLLTDRNTNKKYHIDVLKTE